MPCFELGDVGSIPAGPAKIQLTHNNVDYIIQHMRGSYSGNTLAFQANADSSILLPRSKYDNNGS